MSSRIDRPQEPQNSLKNESSSQAEKKKWHGRDIQEQTQIDQKKISHEIGICILSASEDISIPQDQEGPSKKRTRKFEKSLDEGLEGRPSSKKAYKVQVVQEKVLSEHKNETAESSQSTDKKQKHDEETSLESQIAALEMEYHKQQQSLLSLAKRVYFEAAKDEHLISVITQDEYKNIDSKLGWSQIGLQLLITEKKISEYCTRQRKELLPVFQPILETLQRSKKCFLSYDLLYKNHPPEAHAHLLKQIVLSIEQAIHNVPIGQSILIPAGYSIHEAGGGGRGHIVHLVFTRTSETSFKLEVYNTGDGVVLHLCSETTPKKYYPKLYLGIERSELTKDFFSKIIHLMDLNEGEQSDDIAPFLIYQTIERELKVTEDPEASRMGKPYQDQGLIARCAYSPLSRYVHNALKDHEDVYAEYKLYTTATLITQYTKQLNEEISSESIEKAVTISKNLFEKLQVLGKEVLEDRKAKIEWISCPKRADPEFMLDQVQKNGLFLRFGSEEIRKNMTVAKAAVHNNPKAIYYVHPDLQKDPYFKDHISNVDS